LFTSKDDNLTKSHIIYLESRLSQISQNAGRYQAELGKNPTLANLPRADQDSMEEFLQSVQIVLGVLGHRVLESVNPSDEAVDDSDEQNLTKIKFSFKVRGIEAFGRFSDEGFVLLANSLVVGNVSESMPGRIRAIRESWIADGILVQSGENFKLQTDEVVSSSSYAAALVAGSSRSGPQSWIGKKRKVTKIN